LVTRQVDARLIGAEYLFLLTLGLGLSYFLSFPIFLTEIILAVMGLVYNVKPLRSKDIAYVDVISESFNMGLRLLIGWFLITDDYLPPLSLFLGYWTAGAFLMAVKRLSEYRMFTDKSAAALYRQSLKTYSENSLLVSALFYAMMSVFFSGIFLIKYRIEFVVLIPFICVLFCYYLSLAYSADSAVWRPEKLYKEKKLILGVICLGVLALLLLFTDIPLLSVFTNNKLIEL
jgi:hypothetical protein